MTDVQRMYTYIYIYKRKILIDITCVGLASAHPNKTASCLSCIRDSLRLAPN